MPRTIRKKDDQRSKICREGDNHHFRMVSSLLESNAYKSLTGTAKYLYVLMGIQSNGQNKFYYPESEAIKHMSKDAFHKAKKQLIENGFITALNYRTQKTEYSLSDKWKSK